MKPMILLNVLGLLLSFGCQSIPGQGTTFVLRLPCA